MTITGKTISEWLEECRTIIDGSRSNKESMDRVAHYKYDEKRLAEAGKKLDRAYDLQHKKEDEYGDVSEVSAEMKAKYRKMVDEYGRLHEIADMALEDDIDAYRDLGLHKTKERNYPGLVVQIRTFVENALAQPKILKALSDEFGVTRKEFEDLRDLIDEVAGSKDAFARESSEATGATRERNEVFDDLND